MSVEIRAVFTDPKNAPSIELDGEKMEQMFGPHEDAVALRINEMLTTVRESVERSVTEESELSIEVSGDITLKVDGGVKYLLFNVGGSAETKNTMKVTLKTKVKPRSS